LATYVKTKHDIGFLRQDGSTKVGLRVAKDKNGNPLYKTIDDDYLAQQMYTGTPSYSNLPPEKELALIQDDWRSGFGQETYDVNDPKRYFSSIGMDMRYKGMAVAGPVATGITMPAPQWANPTGFVDGSGNWSDEAKAYDDDMGTYASGGAIAAETWSDYLELTIDSTGIDGIRFYAEVYASTGTDQIDIDLYYSSAWHDLYEGTFTAKVWTAEFDKQTVTAARVRLYNGDTGSSRTPRLYEFDFLANTGGTAINPVAFAEFNDELYTGDGKWLLKLNAAGDGFLVRTPGEGFAANITDLEPFTDNYLYIAIGLSNEYWYMTTAEAFTEAPSLKICSFSKGSMPMPQQCGVITRLTK